MKQCLYGLPGASFDRQGNLYLQHGDGSKEWIGPYRDWTGAIVKDPNQRAEEDCCYTIFGNKGSYDI